MKKIDPSIIVIILTAYSNISDAVKVVKEGAYNYLEKPISSENLVALIKRAIKARTLVETTFFSAPTLSLGHTTEDQFVGESDEMKKVFQIITKLSQVNTPVLIRGESGTGKELVAKAIHFNGPRKDEKFITINLAAIPETLIESELFGHEKGAFTGATERKIGKFQFADGGTIFLDEIGDISAPMQVKLLRVLQEKTFTPVGANRDIKVDVRIIAASHRPFEEMIRKNEFREDLFYRLNVLPVYLPPLRERVADIPLLVDYYIQYFNRVHLLNVQGATPESIERLKNYSWPGNIRELRNVIEHSFIIESGDYLTVSSLPNSVLKNTTTFHSHSYSETQSSQQHDSNYHKEKTKKEDFNRNHQHVQDANNFVNNLIDEEEEDDDLVINESSSMSASSIDLEDLKSSILENSNSYLEYSFTFATRTEDNKVIMDYQLAKDLFEREFIIQALKINKGRINQTALKANIPKKTLLRKIEKYGITAKNYSLSVEGCQK